MYPQSPRGRIHPKISTLPRQRSEASNYLDIYKLVIEKKRLQQELETLARRQHQIHQRLESINHQVEGLKQAAEQAGQQDADEGSISEQQISQAEVRNAEVRNISTYETVVLDY